MNTNPPSPLRQHRTAALREKFLRETENYLARQLQLGKPAATGRPRWWRNRLRWR